MFSQGRNSGVLSQNRNSGMLYKQACFIKISKICFIPETEISRNFLISTQTEISKTLFYLPKAEASNHSFIYLSRKYLVYGCQPKNISHSLFVKRFCFSIFYILFYTELVVVFHTQECFYIIHYYILAFCFSFSERS